MTPLEIAQLFFIATAVAFGLSLLAFWLVSLGRFSQNLLQVLEQLCRRLCARCLIVIRTCLLRHCCPLRLERHTHLFLELP